MAPHNVRFRDKADTTLKSTKGAEADVRNQFIVTEVTVRFLLNYAQSLQ